MITETFVIRDDGATCADCTWKDEWDTGRPVDIVRRSAKKHAVREGHQVTLRRVQFIRYTGRAVR